MPRRRKTLCLPSLPIHLWQFGKIFLRIKYLLFCNRITSLHLYTFQENLRKHVLRSGRHAGLYLYKCQLCHYQINTAKSLREHLVENHADKFDSKTALQAVKTHLMVARDQEKQWIKVQLVDKSILYSLIKCHCMCFLNK